MSLSIDFADRATHVPISTVRSPDLVDIDGTIYLVTSKTSTDSNNNPVVDVVSMQDGSVSTIQTTTKVIALQSKIVIGNRF